MSGLRRFDGKSKFKPPFNYRDNIGRAHKGSIARAIGTKADIGGAPALRPDCAPRGYSGSRSH
jgi:hypothetical protein